MDQQQVAQILQNQAEADAAQRDDLYDADMLHRRQSTPKTPQNWFKSMEMIEKFLAREKRLSFQMDQVEKFVTDGLESRARIVLREIEEVWTNFYNELGAVLSLPGENEKQYCALFERIADRYYQAQDEIGKQSGQCINQQITMAPIKLKPLKIPTFDGTYDNWPTFHSLFGTLIIKTDSISDIEKMQYLKSALMDDAERVIAHLHIAEDSFGIAWAILCERFDNKRALVDGQITSILELEWVDGSSAQELRKFYDNSKGHFEMLKDIPTDQLL